MSDVLETAAGAEALAAFLRENAETFAPGFGPTTLLRYCSSASEFEGCAAPINGPLVIEGKYVRAVAVFGPFRVQVYTNVENVLERPEQIEMRPVNVGRWQFVGGLESLNDRLEQPEEAKA